MKHPRRNGPRDGQRQESHAENGAANRGPTVTSLKRGSSCSETTREFVAVAV